MSAPVAKAVEVETKQIPVAAPQEPVITGNNRVEPGYENIPQKPITPTIVSEQPTTKPISKPESNPGEVKVSAFSLSGLRMKRELAETQKANVKNPDELPREKFNETDMRLQWNKYAQRLSDAGQKIMATYMQINDPVLDADGVTIRLELPNSGSKIDFDNNKLDLLGYLRGKLHNHDIVIDVHVNEIVSSKHAFTPEEKYEKLKAINPAVEMLRKMFDLDI